MLPAELNQKYDVRGTLGAGAMGTVYDAVDRIIERRVAIKVVNRPNESDPEAVEAHARFRREAQAAVRLATGAIGAIAADPAVSRAEALRRAMVAEIERGGRDANPANWAPFVLVGAAR